MQRWVLRTDNHNYALGPPLRGWCNSKTTILVGAKTLGQGGHVLFFLFGPAGCFAHAFHLLLLGQVDPSTADCYPTVHLQSTILVILVAKFTLIGDN